MKTFDIVQQTVVPDGEKARSHRHTIAEGVLFSDGQVALKTTYNNIRSFHETIHSVKAQHIAGSIETRSIVFHEPAPPPPRKPDPVKTTVTISLGGKDLRDYIFHALHEQFDREIRSGGTL